MIKTNKELFLNFKLSYKSLKLGCKFLFERIEIRDSDRELAARTCVREREIYMPRAPGGDGCYRSLPIRVRLRETDSLDPATMDSGRVGARLTL